MSGIRGDWPDLLIGSQRGLWLLRNGQFSRFIESEAPFYGITWNEENVFVSADAELYCLSSSGDRKVIKNGLKYNNGQGRIHQILCEDHRLFITNTGKNRIDVYDLRTHQYTSVDCNQVIAEADAHHLNSLFLTAESQIYVCNHNRGKSFIRVFDSQFKELRTFTQVGVCNHNVYIEDGKLITLNSSAGRITFVNLVSGEHSDIEIDRSIFADENLRFARGLTRTRDRILVAVSRLSDDRDLRDAGGIIMYNNNFEPLDALRIPVAAQIYEIRVISEVDHAHNRLPFPLAY